MWVADRKKEKRTNFCEERERERGRGSGLVCGSQVCELGLSNSSLQIGAFLSAEFSGPEDVWCLGRVFCPFCGIPSTALSVIMKGLLR